MSAAVFVHVLGAMLLLGTLFAVALAAALGWRRGGAESVALARFGLRSLLVGVVPGYVLMRAGAEWAASQLPEGLEDSTWIGIGYATADAGAALVLVSIVLAVLGLRRLRRGDGAGFGRAVGIVSAVLLLTYVFTVWAMTTKPV